jgi:predicted Fe-Mo cluster-binding NifX family protein
MFIKGVSMIAVPVKTEKGDVIAPLFGKAKYFSLIDKQGLITTQLCSVQGGMNVVPWLQNLGVKTVLLNHVGEKPFHALLGAHIDVYYVGKERIMLNEALDQMHNGTLEKVTVVNYMKLLGEDEHHHEEEGGHSHSGGCGCGH